MLSPLHPLTTYHGSRYRNPPDYRATLPNSTLVFRWATEADSAGCAMFNALIFCTAEGEEAAMSVRINERRMRSDWFKPCQLSDVFFDEEWMVDYRLVAVFSADWAICVDTSGPKGFTRAVTATEPEDPYVARIRADASSAKESLVAVISWNVDKWVSIPQHLPSRKNNTDISSIVFRRRR